MAASNVDPCAPSFWRDDALPFVEARAVRDGRGVCYGKHAHETFSIGAVTGGESVYANGQARQRLNAGSVVVVNPQDCHACNPVDATPWSYLMFHVDAAWLARLQHELGLAGHLDFHMFSTTASRNPALHGGLVHLHAVLTDPAVDSMGKHGAAIAFFSGMHQLLAPASTGAAKPAPQRNLARAADYIRENRGLPLKLDDIGEAAGLSASHLIRAFKKRYGMTPHAYLVNCRVEYAKARLKRGHAIADVAVDAGFADQAHLQRVFKQLVAATPGQYRN